MQTKKGHFCFRTLIYFTLILSLISTGFLHSSSTEALAIKTSNPGCETVSAIFISDKITEVAYRLGVVPVAYCARCGAKLNKDLSTVKRLGCYKTKVETVLKAADMYKIKFALVEDAAPAIFKKKGNWYKKYGEHLKEKGYKVYRIDFSKGIPEAIVEIGKVLSKEEKAKELAGQYAERLEMTKRKIPATKVNKKILVLKGAGKRSVQVEAPGGYTDQFLLEPLGCVNVGDKVKSKDTKVIKCHFNLENWQAIVKAGPDIIVKCGNPYPVERGFAKALKKYPELSSVPAIKNHAVYTLPVYIDSSVTQYPMVLSTWIDAICR